jgi:hypothetical protein
MNKKQRRQVWLLVVITLVLVSSAAIFLIPRHDQRDASEQNKIASISAELRTAKKGNLLILTDGRVFAVLGQTPREIIVESYGHGTSAIPLDQQNVIGVAEIITEKSHEYQTAAVRYFQTK